MKKFKPFWSLKSFPNLLSQTSSFLESLHDLIMVWLVVILLTVMIVSGGILLGPYASIVLDSRGLEVFWTLVPVFILLSLAYPSIYLLCFQDSVKGVFVSSLKVVSRQWNWGSEYLEESNDHLLDFDLMENISSLEVPVLVKQGVVRLLLTSTDVLHSLGVPSLGVKLDSVPGRLNFTTLEASSLCLHWGSCYELCGGGHSSMPLTFLVL